MKLPACIESEDQLEDVMTTPSPELVESLTHLEGDILILGVAGKMGPTLARLARRALDEAGKSFYVIGVARFTDTTVRDKLEDAGVETIAVDLLQDNAMLLLPEAPNVLYLAARKFGSTGNEPLTWAMNTYLPALVADRYRHSRIVALSTGNVYPFTPVDQQGPSEDVPPEPVGEYAQSCLGRERMFQYFSQTFDTPMSLIRLNYAIDLRYGVLLDVASKVHAGLPINLGMGYTNVIWQGDANTAILRSLALCSVPPFILNLTGAETVSIRNIALEFGTRFGKTPILHGTEEPTALLSNASKYQRIMGPPVVPLSQMIDWITYWVASGHPTWNKPTHYQVRDGQF